ncbi:DgyrCDS1756 [Dimorphilus gyrociliatus]|uniref:Sialin n=1 Tax=Dimorphilus gyrociliatus TaxID=2664684 RepID=A0A7I8VB43_9ANNE|nr:DgyrCDS1756 [Dimorphilus gyrociliatus]
MTGGGIQRSSANQMSFDERRSIRKSFSQELNELGPADDEPLKLTQKIPKRYIVAALAFLGFCNIYALRVNLSIALVAMTDNETAIVTGSVIHVSEFKWSKKVQGYVLSSFFWGYIITQLPGGYLATKYGGKNLFGGGVVLTAILALISPPSARVNEKFFITIRILQGLCEGVTYPAIHAVWSKWAPPLERTKLATFAFAGSYVGTVIAMPLSGVIADRIGWPWIFYIFGLLAIGWFILWCVFVSESPAKHRSISTAELEYIQVSIGYSPLQIQNQKPPIKSILLSMPVWAIVVAHFTENWGFYTLLTELPTYLKDFIRFDLYSAGFVAALPYFLMAIVVMLGGQLADYIRSKGLLKTTPTRKLFTGIAFIGQAAFMIATSYCTSKESSVACLTLAVGIGGLAWSGFSVNHLDIAPQFAGLLMGITNTIATIPGIASPIITGEVIPHKVIYLLDIQ